MADYAPIVHGPIIWTELPVQYALADFLEPGDTALDVGANLGRISIALRRIVGPTGQVHAIEANPNLIPKLNAELYANGAQDVKVVHKAVFNKSGVEMEFFCDDSLNAVGSSLFRDKKGWDKAIVQTITIDDYVRENNLQPKVIKLDVEDAEYEALQGAEQTLKKFQPVVAFEYGWRQNNERDTLNLFKSLGYRCYDLNFYKEVDPAFYAALGSLVFVNVVAIPPIAMKKADYSDIRLESLGVAIGQTPLQAPTAGRYIAHAEVSGDEQGISTLRIVDQNNAQLSSYDAPLKHLQHHSCSHLILKLDGPAEVHAEIQSHEGRDVRVDRFELSRITFGPPPPKRTFTQRALGRLRRMVSGG